MNAIWDDPVSSEIDEDVSHQASPVVNMNGKSDELFSAELDEDEVC